MGENNQSNTRQLSNDEIIVYLDSHSKKENGTWELYVDFKAKEDFERFQKVMQFRLGDSVSYLKLQNVKTYKHLKTDCYYKLNVEKLKDLSLSVETESYVFAGSYDLSEMGYPKSESEEILQSHLPFVTHEVLDDSCLNYLTQHELISEDLNNPSIYVANVGQANWNELRDNGKPLIVFDCGAPIDAKINEVDNIWNRHVSLLHKYKPTLIISHWDLDHYHCLKKLSDSEVKNCFSCAICVNVTMSITSRAVLSLLREALGDTNVIALAPPTKQKRNSPSKMVCKKCDHHVALYVGQKSRSINLCGLCLFVDGFKRTAIFTGDLRLSQCDEVCCNEHQNLESKGHILIVPHHGAYCKPCFKKYTAPIAFSIISVGKDNNYGHPSMDLVNYMSSRKCVIIRTDKCNNDVIIDL